MISAGERLTHGTSPRTPRQVLIARQMKPGSQETPDSSSTNVSVGNLLSTPLEIRLRIWSSNVCDCAT